MLCLLIKCSLLAAVKETSVEALLNRCSPTPYTITPRRRYSHLPPVKCLPLPSPVKRPFPVTCPLPWLRPVLLISIVLYMFVSSLLSKSLLFGPRIAIALPSFTEHIPKPSGCWLCLLFLWLVRWQFLYAIYSFPCTAEWTFALSTYQRTEWRTGIDWDI